MITPKVSIIIPNYYHEFFLKKRLQRMIEQSYTNYEVILLDDNSSNNSLSILSEYSLKLRYKNLISKASAIVFRASEFSTKSVNDMVNYRYTGDWLYCLRRATQGSTFFMDDPLHYFRFHKQSRRNNFDLQKALNRLLAAFSIIKFNENYFQKELYKNSFKCM